MREELIRMTCDECPNVKTAPTTHFGNSMFEEWIMVSQQHRSKNFCCVDCVIKYFQKLEKHIDKHMPLR